MRNKLHFNFSQIKQNLEEVSSFMRVAGASSAICSGDFNLNLYGSKSVSGVILKNQNRLKMLTKV